MLSNPPACSSEAQKITKIKDDIRISFTLSNSIEESLCFFILKEKVFFCEVFLENSITFFFTN